MTTASPQPPEPRIVHGDEGLFADCPDCNSRDFLIDDAGPVLFACLGCGSKWRYTLGYVWRLETEETGLGTQP